MNALLFKKNGSLFKKNASLFTSRFSCGLILLYKRLHTLFLSVFVRDPF